MPAPSSSSSHSQSPLPTVTDATADVKPPLQPLNFSIPIPLRVTGKRGTENTTARVNSTAAVSPFALTASATTPTTTSAAAPFSGGSALQMLGDMDLSTISPLCHQLLETKKRMLSELSASADDAGGDGDVRSDDDEPAHASTAASSTKPLTAYKQSKVKTESRSSAFAVSANDALSPEAILQRKAQRRREQRETEDLRKKVFQLEEFISHTIKSYEWELRQQRLQLEALTRENERLQRASMDCSNSLATIGSPASARAALELPLSDRRGLSSVSPAGVDSPMFGIKSEEIAPFARAQTPPSVHAVTTTAAMTVSDQWRAYDDIEHLYAKVAETKQILSKILVPPAHPEIAQKAFGWEFQFWLEGTRYYAKSSKFFVGVRGFDVAQRMHRIEPARYIETFPEVYAKKVLKVFHEHLKIVETVKVLPGKQPLGSVTVQFVSHDDTYAGNRCFFANRSVALPQSTNFGHHEECNGYAFEDMTRTASDGSVVEGCLVQGVGGYDSMGKQPEVLMAELAKIFSSVVLRWESLFVNDYIPEDVEASLADIELDF